MRISDWSSDVCSSDLRRLPARSRLEMEDRSESDRASARGAPGIVFEEGVDQRVPEDRLGDIDSGFFSRFANCSLDDAFAVIEEAAGKGPKTLDRKSTRLNSSH